MNADQVLNGRFRLVREIGRGGFGAVYEAEVIGPPGGAVAVKVLDRHAADTSDFEARFLREVRNAKRVVHPNAIAVHEFGSLPDGRVFYSMELCRGRSLRAAVEDGPLDPARAVGLMAQALGALGAAHAIGMVHRDVKPDNILIVRGPDGREQAKLLDFGLAKMRTGTASQDLTTDGRIHGTLLCMPPEQILGKPLDGRADLYAAGATLFYVLSGSPPFVHDDPSELAFAIVKRPPPALATLTGGRVPAALAAAVARSLAKRPEQRFASAEEMAAALLAAVPEAGPIAAVAAEPTTAPAAATPQAAGATVIAGRYEVVREVARSRRGRLFEAIDLGGNPDVDRRTVALKVLDGHLPVPEDGFRRYMRDLTPLLGLAHDRLVRVLAGALTDAGAPCFVSEWVRGEPLPASLERGPLAPALAGGVVADVLEALEAAHAAGVLHGDLTSAQVLVEPAGDTGGRPRARLRGFGRARTVFADAAGKKAWTKPLGSPGWMPLEQLQGKPLDARSDVFAAGVLLFVALSGRAPYPTSDPVAALKATLAGPPPLPDTVPEPVRAAAAPILARALATRREDRLESAAAFRAALAAVASLEKP